MILEEVRLAALALPGAVEAPHFHFTSFRVGGRIFATAPPEGDFVHLMVDEHAANAYAECAPDRYELLWWGKRVVGLRAALAGADPAEISEILREAWLRRAPRRTRSDG